MTHLQGNLINFVFQFLLLGLSVWKRKRNTFTIQLLANITEQIWVKEEKGSIGLAPEIAWQQQWESEKSFSQKCERRNGFPSKK